MRVVFRLIGAVIIFVIVAAVSLLLLPADRIARIATDQITAATGRAVTIAGDVGFTLWPVLGVEVADLTVSGPDWSDKGPTLQAKHASFGMDAAKLLRGEIAFTHLTADQPSLILEQKADGRASWVLDAPAVAPVDTSGAAAVDTTDQTPAPTAPSAAAPAFTIASIEVADASLVYHAEGSATQRLDGLNVLLDRANATDAVRFDASLQPAGQPVKIEGAIDSFDAFLNGDLSNLQGNLATRGGTLTFTGRAATTGAVAGTLALKTALTAQFFAALALPAIDLPAKLGREIDLKTDLTLTPDLRLALRDIVLGMEGNTVRGAADIVFSEPPLINAQFDVGAFDLSEVFEPTTAPATPAPAPATQGQSAPSAPVAPAGNSAPQGASGGWSIAPIDASFLAAFDGEIALRAAQIDLGSFALGPTRAILRNERSRLVIDLRDVQAYGGAFTGEFVVNNRSGLSVGGRLEAQQVQMQPLLVDAIDFDRVTGAADLSFSFLGVGASLRDIMNSLSGDGRLAVAQGTLLGINLDRLMRGDPTASGTTIFDSLTGSWAIIAGVLQNDDLLLQLRNYEARGKGVIGLGAQNMDYTVTPIALRANSGDGLAIPVRFLGPWSDISIRPDLEAALDLRIDEEIDKIKEEAKAKADAEIDKLTDEAKAKADAEIDNLEADVKEKLAEELGITPSGGQSTEDAIKEEVGQRLLRKLFD